MMTQNRIIAIDQSTSATKALLFDENCHIVARSSVDHKQYYPQSGWVEHDAEEIYNNMVEAIRQVIDHSPLTIDHSEGAANNAPCSMFHVQWSIAITNQRETAVVWNKKTGKPIANAVVWQDTRGVALCRQLLDDGIGPTVMAKSGLLIDPNFSASGVKWLLDNTPGARGLASQGELLMGTIDTWLIWKLTGGRVHATDTTNASRTMLFNIHTMQWDDDLLALFNIPRSMMPEVKACDEIYGETTVEGLFPEPIAIAGVLGDSHGALVGQMCFDKGSGKVTYGTGSSVMVNIGHEPLTAPEGLVTSVGFSAFGKTWYGFEGNIYSTGATLKWMCDQLQLVGKPQEMEAIATSVSDNGGVYIVPAFSGLGAPWWQNDVKGAILGLTFAMTKAHVVRAALESIAFQVKDLLGAMFSPVPLLQRTNTDGHGITSSVKNRVQPMQENNTAATGLTTICADGGPTKNRFLMQLQADLLQTPIVCTEVDDASALGAALMNGFARGLWKSFDEVIPLRKVTDVYQPQSLQQKETLYAGWRAAVNQLIK